MAYYPQSATGLAASRVVGDLTSSASANTKGAYVQYVASSAFQCNFVELTALAANSNGVRYLIDIAIGAGGAETVVVPNIIHDAPTSSGQSGFGVWAFPLTIPASTRIAGRCQSSGSSKTVFSALTIHAAGGVDGPTSYVNYGASTADSGGTNVDPGGTVNTKGSYSQLAASSTAVAQVVVIMAAQDGNSVPNDSTMGLDISTGAGGAEVVLLPDLAFATLSSQNPTPPRSRTRLTYIPASTRISARAANGINDATDRLIDVAMLAATAPTETSGSGYSRGRVVNA